MRKSGAAVPGPKVLFFVEAIMLAEKLGYKEPVIRVHEAKNYIKQLKLQYNLK